MPLLSSFWIAVAGSKEKKEVSFEQNVTFLDGSDVRFVKGVGV